MGAPVQAPPRTCPGLKRLLGEQEAFSLFYAFFDRRFPLAKEAFGFGHDKVNELVNNLIHFGPDLLDDGFDLAGDSTQGDQPGQEAYDDGDSSGHGL